MDKFQKKKLNNLNIFESSTDWRVQHKEVIIDFLTYLNRVSDKFILKGGTSLMLCYNLDRFSEDIYLDSISRNNINKIVESFCKLNNYSFRTEKDINTVNRFMINYGNQSKPLKVEISFRNKNISDSFVCNINNIKVYTIEVISTLKVNAFQKRDKLRDLYDLVFICKNYWNDLPSIDKFNIINVLGYRGLEFIDYLTSTQKDDLIDNNKLLNDYLDVAEKIGIQL